MDVLTKKNGPVSTEAERKKIKDELVNNGLRPDFEIVLDNYKKWHEAKFPGVKTWGSYEGYFLSILFQELKAHGFEPDKNGLIWVLQKARGLFS